MLMLVHYFMTTLFILLNVCKIKVYDVKCELFGGND